MHRFLLTNLDCVSGGKLVICSPELLHQWNKVLRFRVEERVAVFDGCGKEWEVRIEELGQKLISCAIEREFLNENELSVKLILAQSLLKNPEKMEWVFQKGTELGVAQFVPIISQRTERQTLHKRQRAELIIKEAVEQSGRGRLPVLAEEMKLQKFLDDLNENVLVLIADFVGEKKIGELVGLMKAAGEVVILVGPEGGFTDQERDLFGRVKNVQLVNLGKRVLRSETASIVMAALCQEVL